MRQNGFTLVELLVVIALIALLAGLLFPVLVRVRERARAATCLSQISQIARAHALYLQDWEERFPDWRLPTTARPEPCSGYRYWTEYLQPYLRSNEVFRDPGAARDPTTCTKLADYALMTWGPEAFMRMAGSGTQDDPYFRFPGPPLSLFGVVRPSETISVSDGWTTTGATQGRLFRHGAGTNVAFVDGHVRWLRIDETRRVETGGRGFYWLHFGTSDR